ncbi:hypothetical protein [Psychroserpens sp.]|uniref:hypothetical protein n=1 Tax=Psychroserpens sp. TaxID=2020870 RepID=UPI001B2ADD12|nr:hypothetical protein [Psychroserpens sp.]MBO6606099.1 hypothetical protein [Psychroserpens sp.]MBO6630607.1 hypothetical protein [Psychroserpens sp.]MBO6652530.1 hypothetical protein [Psychroserpens sp.]MBO6681698.1 hypothetical protein [Psychroserpens sp.]MBO6749473.1 hypothetical protein [Psychroserpens sp.]
MATLDAGTIEKRDAYVKSLDGVINMAEDEEYIEKVKAHQTYLQELEYIDIPQPDLTRLTDSLVASKGFALDKADGKYYIDPNKDFKKVTSSNPTGAYLYIFINQNQMFLEFVNYTNGKKHLSMNKVEMVMGETKFEYYLNWVTPKGDGFEYCTIETNTNNFIAFFEQLSSYDGVIKMTFFGEKKNRSVELPEEMITEIKNGYELYSYLIKN